jgi:ribosomal protein S18 acetylase RimI-like enzyme
VRAGELSDVDQIAAIHMEAFAGFFLAELGRGFVTQLYRGFLQSPSGLTLVAISDGKVAGFVVGTTEPESFFRSLLRTRWFTLLSASVPALWRQPLRVAPKLWSALWYRGERPANIAGGALLSSVGVSPREANQGTGSILVNAFCDWAAQRNKPYVYLTTDRDGNEASNRFYLRLGFQVDGTFQKEKGRWMNRYVRTLQPQEDLGQP